MKVLCSGDGDDGGDNNGDLLNVSVVVMTKVMIGMISMKVIVCHGELVW